MWRSTRSWESSDTHVCVPSRRQRGFRPCPPQVPIAVGLPTTRDGSVFTWSDERAARFVELAGAAGLDVRPFEVSDPNIVAHGGAIASGIDAVLGAR